MQLHFNKRYFHVMEIFTLLFLLIGHLGADVPLGRVWERVDLHGASTANDFVISDTKLIAVGSNGAIWHTVDRENWIRENSGVSVNLRSIAKGGSTIVAVGNHGMVVRSVTSGVWTAEYVGQDVNLTSVAYGNGIFVAVGSRGKAFWSASGQNWQAWETGVLTKLNHIIWQGGAFHAAGDGDTLISTSVGGTWNEVFPPTNAFVKYTKLVKNNSGYYLNQTNSRKDVIARGDHFIGVGSGGTTGTSQDGVSWTTRITTNREDYIAVKWTGNEYVAITALRSIASSQDGERWTSKGLFRNYSNGCWTGSQYVVVGRNGIVATSPDGLVWTSEVKSGSEDLIDVASSGAITVCVGTEGGIYRSLDGITWEKAIFNSASYLHDVYWSGNKFWVVGLNGLIIESIDGLNWTINCPGRLDAIVWDGSRFLAFSGQNILTSVDGNQWSTLSHVPWPAISTNPDFKIRDLIWTGQHYLAVGEQKWLLRSTDGINWTQGTTTSYLLNASTCAYSGDEYVTLSSNSNRYLVSSNGLTWVNHEDANFANAYYKDIIWDGNRFVAVASNRVLSSADGKMWNLLASINLPRPGSPWVIDKVVFRSVAWNGNRYIAAGHIGADRSRGYIGTSVDGVTWTHLEIGDDGEYTHVATNGSTAMVLRNDGVVKRITNTILLEENTGLNGVPTGLLAHAGGYAAFNDVNMISNSPTTGTWQLGNQRVTSQLLRCIIFANGIYVIGGQGWHGSDAAILTSSDGINWSQQTFPGYQGPFANILWGGSSFLMQAGSSIYTSPDGITWTPDSSGWGPGNAHCIALFQGEVVVGGNSRIWQRQNNTVQVVQEFSNSAVTGFMSNGNEILGVGSGELWCSNNGSDWGTKKPKAQLTSSIKDVIYSPSGFLACGDAEKIWKSSDGDAWSVIEVPQLPQMNALVEHSGLYVAVGRGFAYSNDGVNWESATSHTEYIDVAYGNGFYVAVSDSHAATSQDGMTWQTIEYGLGSKFSGKSVIWTGSVFLMSSETGATATSPDGAAWQINHIPGVISGISASDSKYVICNSLSDIYHSSDGVQWKQIENRIGYRVTYTGGMFFAFDPFTYRSSDGVTWASLNQSYNDIVWIGNKFVAVGESGSVATSLDGVTWTSITSGISMDLNRVAWTGSLVIAVGENGTIITSPDGMSWTSVSSNTVEALVDVSWLGNQYACITSSGLILYSNTGPPPPAGFVINDLWSDTNNSIIVGKNGRIAELVNNVWVEKDSGTLNDLCVVTQTPSGIQACGAGGIMIKRLANGTWNIGNGFPNNTAHLTNWGKPKFPVEEHFCISKSISGVLYALGNLGSIATSSDGVVWSQHAHAENLPLSGIAGSTGLLHVVGSQGSMFTVNGNHTISEFPKTGYDLNAVVYGNDRLVAVGEQGIILVSKSGVGVPFGYDKWADQEGLVVTNSAPSEDPNSDSISNLQSYSFGIPPLGITNPSLLSRFPTINRNRMFTFYYRKNTPDIEAIIEKSEDLVSWSEVGRRIGLGGWSGVGLITQEMVDESIDKVTVGSPSVEQLDQFYRIRLLRR